VVRQADSEQQDANLVDDQGIREEKNPKNQPKFGQFSLHHSIISQE
jgi:hypothetical protein